MHTIRFPCLLAGLCSVLLTLTSCATIPEALRTSTEPAPTLTEVRRGPVEAFLEREVVWGGVIASVHNHAAGTTLEIVSRSLGKDLRPREEDFSEGRFRVAYPDFLEPAIFAPGRAVTIRGRITGQIRAPVGEFAYAFPVVDSNTVHLWPKLPPPPPFYWRDPFWDPWWSWGAHPWVMPIPVQ
jgi:outer membrane lipoprotein